MMIVCSKKQRKKPISSKTKRKNDFSFFHVFSLSIYSKKKKKSFMLNWFFLVNLFKTIDSTYWNKPGS